LAFAAAFFFAAATNSSQPALRATSSVFRSVANRRILPRRATQFIDAGAERAFVPMLDEITGTPSDAAIKQID